VGLGERAAEDCKVLREDEDASAFDEAVAGDDAVARKFLAFEAEVCGAVLDELVELFERAFVQKELDALARSPLARLVLALDARGASAFGGAALQFEEPFEFRGMGFARFRFHKPSECPRIMSEARTFVHARLKNESVRTSRKA
jgi:hypothetical protein